LKFVEAGMMDVAVIASNVGPYSHNGVNFFEKGGKINNNGNCILIENRKAHKDWAKAIEKLVKNPEYVSILQNNMRKYVIDTYNINNVTAERAEWYKEICKK
jgi:glycosyltransferase involved in cell wall biosynthesis